MDGHHGEEQALRAAYQNSLKLAKEHGFTSIAFPLISAGIYGYPRAQAMSAATQAILDFLKDEEEEPAVSLVLYDKKDLGLRPEFHQALENLLQQGEAERYREELLLAQRSRDASYLKELADQSRREDAERAHYPEYSLPAYQAADPEMEKPGRKTDDVKHSPAKKHKWFSRPGLSRSKKDTVSSGDRGKEQDPVFPNVAAAPIAGGQLRQGLEELIGNLDEGFSMTLLRLIDSQGKTDPEVYKKANLDRRLFSKIRSNSAYRPSKNTVLALSIALQLNRQQTQDLLRRAGFALSPSAKMDVIVGYYIDQGLFDIHAINEALFYYDQPLLGESV